jgi:hypothetical protein
MTNYHEFKNNLNECIQLNECLANYLLPLKEGDRLLSTREFSILFDVSLGSISYALNYFEEIGAVTLDRRGRLGSYLKHKSLGILWRIIENGPMVIALTLPSFPKGEGLATAIYSMLDNAGIEIYLIFVRGSHNRLKALRNKRCHAVVMSTLAADALIYPDEEIIFKLPPQSFVTDHRIFYRSTKEENTRSLRVGIDLDSFDIKYLTELEFSEHEVEYCPMNYLIADRHFEQSSVDAAISNLDHVDQLTSKEILSRPLSPKVQEIIGDRNTSAAFIVKSESISTKVVLREILDPNAILDIQQKVVDRQIAPRY